MSAWLRLVRIETRRAFRAPRTRGVIGALFLATGLSWVVGAAVAHEHARAGERDAAASRARTEELATRGRDDAAGEAPLPPQSAFELGTWHDTLVARGTRATSGLAAGDLASIPDGAVIRVYEPPALVPALAERAPAAVLLGTLDLSWVLALLLPLAAIALGYDSIARDRERGTLAMLLGSGRGLASLLAARSVALWAALSAGVLPACALGAIWVAVSSSELASLGVLLVLVAIYLAFWAVAVVSFSALSERSATALAALLVGWLALGFAVPLASSGLGRLAYPEPDPRSRIAGEQAATDVFDRPSESVLEAEIERDPKLDPELGADGATSLARQYFLLSHERLRRARGAQAEAERALLRRAELAELTSWLSPTSMVSGALAALAGARPTERLAFAADAERYRAAVERFVRDEVLANRGPLDDPARWPALDRTPAASLQPALVASAVLLALIVLAFVATMFRARSMQLAPTKEDA